MRKGRKMREACETPIQKPFRTSRTFRTSDRSLPRAVARARGSIDRRNNKAPTMMHEAEMTTNPPTTDSPARSPAAERMRLHRTRRRYGLRCLWIELRETEIDTLIRKGMLRPETRHDANSVRKAIYSFFESTLGVKPEQRR